MRQAHGTIYVQPDVTPTRMRHKAKHDCASSDQQFLTLEPHHSKELQQDRTGISTAMVIWCNPKSTLTFRHYLSLVSLAKVLKPDEINFIYAFAPLQDNSGYHQWLKKFGEEYPFLRVKYEKGCCRDGKPKRKWIIERMSAKRGGLFVNIDIVLKHFSSKFFNKQFEAHEIFDQYGSTDLLSMSRQFALKMYQRTRTGMSYFYNDTAMRDINIMEPCVQVSTLPEIEFYNVTSNKNVQCLRTIDWGDGLYPKMIKDCTSNLCRYLQILNYGYDHTNCAKDNTDLEETESASNVVHYIHFGRFNLDFMFYLSILSFIYIQQVDKVYIHCDQEPKGKYWTKLVSEEGRVIQIVHRTNPNLVFSQSIGVVQHMADIAKADIAYKYGGILSDPDVIIVQKLNKNWFHNDAVVGLDIGSIFPFPDILNLGIFVCKPGAEFTKLWIESMKTFNDTNWLWNSGKLTYKITEQYPTLALVESRLQVICYKFKCYPTWLPQNLYQNLSTSHETLSHSLQNWTTQAYSFHFTFPEPFFDEKYLQKQTGIAGDVGRYVMKAASRKLY